MFHLSQLEVVLDAALLVHVSVPRLLIDRLVGALLRVPVLVGLVGPDNRVLPAQRVAALFLMNNRFHYMYVLCMYTSSEVQADLYECITENVLSYGEQQQTSIVKHFQ